MFELHVLGQSVEFPQAFETEPHATPAHEGSGQIQELLVHTSSASPQEPHATVRCVPQRSLTVMEPQVALFAVQSS